MRNLQAIRAFYWFAIAMQILAIVFGIMAGGVLWPLNIAFMVMMLFFLRTNKKQRTEQTLRDAHNNSNRTGTY